MYLAELPFICADVPRLVQNQCRCVSASKTGIGKVILVIEDENDNQPKIPAEMIMCEDKKTKLASMVVVAEDKDNSPFSSPFSFSLSPDNDGKWSVSFFNGR